MRFITQTPKKALKAFLKQKPLRSEIDAFKTNLILLLDKISVIENRPTDESEEHLKNDLRDFLRDTYYRDTNAINTKDKKDLVIHLGKSTDSEVGVIIEAKRPNNINEMVQPDNANKKALHELILYYLDERIKTGNNQLKQLVITNVNEWYIMDANYFDKHIYRNTQIKRLYETKLNDKKDNPFFYEEIAKIITATDVEIPCVYFDIRDYNNILRNNRKEDDRELIALFKILSPQHLLKIATPNDSNSLNEKFYKELLHLIGLEEAKENGKNIIRRKKDNRNAASLIEATIEALQTEDILHRLPDQSIYGENKEERIFNVSLELCITWINRILFLKLLEGQLISYHAPSPSGKAEDGADYRFLNSKTINDFDELFKLFHKVLAVNLNDRSDAIKNKYNRVPYLNSSLFEISELEDQTIKINSLDNNGIMLLMKGTVLSSSPLQKAGMGLLNYLFQFLDAYDFASEGTEDVQEDNKTIINASVLGKVFEKINGYKDGSIFTPGFITMYMCRQSIRMAFIQKINERMIASGHQDWKNLETITDVYNQIGVRIGIPSVNEVLNNLKICDPAVGSGHFLVSALNEIIAIKNELGVLVDEHGKKLRGYEIEIINDELIITDENGNPFAYNPKNKESSRVQKTLFREKQTIIENCLFGVDINPNSVKICRLRLWIELLKNAYYKDVPSAPSLLGRTGEEAAALETLPNIDINIKCGNSLLSRFTIDADLSKALKSIKYDVNAYRGFVNEYKNEKNREVKRGLEKIIDSIKSDFRTEISNNDPKQIKLKKLSGDLFTLLNQGQIFELTPKEKKAQKEKQQKLETDITKLATEIDEIKRNAIYKNAFEWRFEFPEVLNNDGEFEGFDVVIGNPPYINIVDLQENIRNYYQTNYIITKNKVDIYAYFLEKTFQIGKANSQFSFIISHTWKAIDSFEKFRKFLFTNYKVTEIVDLDFGVFDAIVKPLIISLQKPIDKIPYNIRVLNENFKLTTEISSDEITSNETYVLDTQSTNQQKSIFTKIENNTVKLETILQFSRGIKTSNDTRFVLKEKKDNDCHKVFRGRNIKGYSINWDNEYVWYRPDLMKEKIGCLPHTKELFEIPEKLITQRVNSSMQLLVAYDNEQNYFLDTTNVSKFNTLNKDYSMKYILSLLNSKVINFWYCNKFRMPTIGLYELHSVPIKEIPPSAQAPFITLVNQILSAKQQGEDTAAYEKQIDELVYQLYNITPEEQKIIEGK